jgi:hypothetical protein
MALFAGVWGPEAGSRSSSQMPQLYTESTYASSPAVESVDAATLAVSIKRHAMAVQIMVSLTAASDCVLISIWRMIFISFQYQQSMNYASEMRLL